MEKFTVGEKGFLTKISKILAQLRSRLQSPEPKLESSTYEWFTYIDDIKRAQGNLNNVISFLSCLMAKEYIMDIGHLAFLEIMVVACPTSGFHQFEVEVPGLVGNYPQAGAFDKIDIAHLN